jgi:uncharacterized protein (DUF433 family)
VRDFVSYASFCLAGGIFISRLNRRFCKVRVMAKKYDRITVNPEIMNGQPCIRDMRITVRRLVEAVALYTDRDELKAEYPGLEDEDIQQALEFAADNLDDQVISLGAA